MEEDQNKKNFISDSSLLPKKRRREETQDFGSDLKNIVQ